MLKKVIIPAERIFVTSKHSLRNIFFFSCTAVVVSRFMLIILGIICNRDIDFVHHTTSIWDNEWYMSIIRNGYPIEPTKHDAGDAASWAFFPLDALIIRFFSLNGILDYSITGIVVNSMLFILGLVQGHRYIMLTRNSVNISITFILLMCFGPYNFYFSSLYTESLFFLLCITCLLELQKKHYIKFGVFGMLLSACRVTGVFVVFSALFFILKEHFLNKNKNFVDFLKATLCNSRLIIGVCMVPAGLFAYMLYLYNLTGDSLAFMHIQKAWRSGIGSGPVIIFWNSLRSESFVDVFYAFYLLMIFFVVIYTFKKYPAEIIMYFVPVMTTILTTPYFLGIGRYSVGTGVFVISFIEMISEHLSKVAEKIIYLFIFLLSVLLSISWYIGRVITI